jgi:hypothetical protein
MAETGAWAWGWACSDEAAQCAVPVALVAGPEKLSAVGRKDFLRAKTSPSGCFFLGIRAIRYCYPSQLR